MKEKIKTEVDKLVSLKLQYAGRASNLFWIGFGDMIQITKGGKTEETAEFVLHIQCSWRITSGNKIVVASRDIYSPRSDWKGDMEDFDWDIQGNNRFDERIKLLMNGKEPLRVEQIQPDWFGGLKVCLTNDYLLEVFPDSSEDDEYSEHWRFFSRKENSHHFVVTGTGIEKV